MMDRKASASASRPTPQPGTTVFRFLPCGPPNEATKKTIRSHVMLETKRKERQQKLINLGARQSRVVAATFEENLCKCTATSVSSSSLDPPVWRTKSQNRSRLAVREEEVAENNSICPRCQRIRFERLSEESQLKVIRWHTPVAAFFGVSCDPFVSTPKLPFGLTAAQSHQFNELKIQVITFFTPGITKTTLLPVAIQNPAVLMGLAYFAAAMLSAVQDESEPSPLANAIKREALHHINLQLNHPDLHRKYATELIPAIAFLSSGLWNFSKGDVGQLGKDLENAADMLVNSGPTWSPPVSDRLSTSLLPLFGIYRLGRAALCFEPVDPRIVHNFPPPLRNSIPDPIVESPLYCGSGDFIGLQSCRGCSTAVLTLLRAARHLIDTILTIENGLGLDRGHEEEVLGHESVKAACASVLTSTIEPPSRPLRPSLPFPLGKSDYPPSGPEVPPPTKMDPIHETIRLATLIIATATNTSCPFRDLDACLWRGLKAALQQTDIGNCWGLMASVLFWVSLVAGSASHTLDEYRYLDSVLRRVRVDLTYRTPDRGALALSTARFGRVVGVLERGSRSRHITGVVQEQERDFVPRTEV